MSEVNIRLTIFQSGILFSMLEQDSELKNGPMKTVYEQLIDIRKQIEKENEVEKELLPSGLLKITDRGGNIIIRPPQEWEGFTFRGEM